MSQLDRSAASSAAMDMDPVFTNPRMSLVRLFAGYLEKMIKMKQRAPSPFGTYYEFGTGWGATLAAFMLAAERVTSSHNFKAADFRVFAFDSFEGLPSSDHPADQHGAWQKGRMANSVETIRHKMQTHRFAKRVPVRYVKGYFKQSLTDALVEELKAFPPSIVTIDVDYYTSTLEALFWLDRFIASGALMYFDDIWAFHGHPAYGQVCAVREFGARNANGTLVPFDTFGEAGKCFIYCRKSFEY
jgi:O-methyltransferase